ncbi:MAG TPA: hypothetical protein VHK90_17220 [Thermoanaerobaculia bacterium]|nr:hypothetical protein [Thermoanaerobaculia bacterium]
MSQLMHGAGQNVAAVIMFDPLRKCGDPEVVNFYPGGTAEISEKACAPV